MKTIIKVGRSAGNDIVINDPNVSGFHCQFRMDESGICYVQDLNSLNGTFVNGVRRSDEINLNQSDIVRIGNTTLPWQTYIPKTIGGGNNYPERKVIGNGIKPNNFLVWAILTTIFCFFPFGIVSIIYASKVDALWNVNDQKGATEAARKAQFWFWWSFGVGVAFWLFWFFYFVLISGPIFGKYL